MCEGFPMSKALGVALIIRRVSSKLRRFPPINFEGVGMREVEGKGSGLALRMILYNLILYIDNRI